MACLSAPRAEGCGVDGYIFSQYYILRAFQLKSHCLAVRRPIWSAHCYFSSLVPEAISVSFFLCRVTSLRISFFRETPSVTRVAYTLTIEKYPYSIGVQCKVIQLAYKRGSISFYGSR